MTMTRDRTANALVQQARRALRNILFGQELPAQEFTIGMEAPQSEVKVWLRGLGDPIDVTGRYAMACAAPLTICISLDEIGAATFHKAADLMLEYTANDMVPTVLGRIALMPTGGVIAIKGIVVLLFEPRWSQNFCVPRLQLYRQYLLYFYRKFKCAGTSDVRMSFLEETAAMVMFIRPHPVALGSVSSESGRNMFTMNIMGSAGKDYFTFALKNSRTPAHLVERVGRIAVSNIPFCQGPIAFQMAANHTRESIDWSELPFPLRRSTTFGFPVPEFATKVRELRVEKVRRIGSHTLFVAAVVDESVYSYEPELCVIHGLYQEWRIRSGVADHDASMHADAFNKHGTHVAQTARQ